MSMRRPLDYKNEILNPRRRRPHELWRRQSWLPHFRSLGTAPQRTAHLQGADRGGSIECSRAAEIPITRRVENS